MPILLWIFLLILAPGFTRNCSHNEEVAVLSQCKNNVMTAIYHWYASDCENANKEPIFNINCLQECPSGKFLSINESDQPDCINCPENTYSTGNSLRFSDLDQNFDEIINYFETHCKYYDGNGFLILDKDCTSWHSTNNNTLLQIGEYKGDSEILYDLFLHTKLINNGSVNFRYQTNFPVSQSDDCEFIMGIDGSTILFEDIIQDRKWHFKSLPLSPGYHEIYWGLYLHRKMGNLGDLIKINLIEITGIHNPSYSCIPCKTGFSSAGSTACTRCGVNQFVESIYNSSCSNCDYGKYAPPGSIGFNRCLNKPLCSEYDYNIQYGKCIEGHRSTTFTTLPQNHFCTGNANSDSFISPCGFCNPGYSNENGECQACQNGYYSKGDVACQKCPENTYSETALTLKYMDEIPSFIKTFCANHNPNVDTCYYFNGWKLVNNSFVTTPNLIEGASLNLEFDVSIESEDGAFEFNYATNCSSQSSLYILINHKQSDLSLHPAMFYYSHLEKGNQKVILSFFSSTSPSNCTMKLYDIKINGEKNGSGGICKSCKDGYYSNPGSTSCISCGEGKARLNGTTCIPCKENYFRNSRMDACEPCPLHTKSNENRTACILYDLYNIYDSFMFNAFKFDTEQDFSAYGNTKKFVSEGFFGPIMMHDQQSILYFSPKIPKKFESEFYEYEDDDNTRDKNSYIFGLFQISQPEFNIFPSSDNDIIVNPRHYRVLKSLGSEIVHVDLNYTKNSTATIKYINGDICIDDESYRYSTNITFVCNKTKNHFKPKFLKYEKCHFEIEWESPYACSECLFEDTQKFQTSCVDETHFTYMDEGQNCILIFNLNGDFQTENITKTKTKQDKDISVSPSVMRFSSLNMNISEDIISSQNIRFSYFDTMVGNCDDLEISFLIVLIFLSAGLGAVIIALICGIQARRYRVDYIALKEDVDNKNKGNAGNPFDLMPNDAPVIKE